LTKCGVISQALWPIEKPVSKRGRQKKPSAIYGPSRLIFYGIDKANVIADCLGNQFRAHDYVTVTIDDM
jgi:hypothetical protein